MAFCKHRVMDKCKKDGRPCIFSEECFDPEEKKPQTNADRIRSVSDEELIKFFGHNSLCSYIQDNDKEWCDKRLACGNCLARWLQQPAEERE